MRARAIVLAILLAASSAWGLPDAYSSATAARAQGGECAAYRAQLEGLASASARKDAIRLRLARCLRDTGATGEAAAEYRAIVASGPLSRSAVLLDEASTFFAAHAVPLAGDFDLAREIVPMRDRQKREAIARVLFLLAKQPGTEGAERALDRLWLEYPDTPAARELASTSLGRARAARATREDAIRRARALLDAPDPPASLAALQQFAPIDTDASPSACEARVLLARALRRLGRVTDALTAARLAAKGCEAGPAAEASYLVVVLMSGREEDPEAQAEEFLRRFPKDSRCDDVLLQRAQLLGRSTDPKRSTRVLERMLALYPEGDMAHEAQFLLAFERARERNAAAARRLLEEGARRAPPGDLADRAAYWSARLRAYPSLDQLKPDPDAAARARGLSDLARLAESRFGSYYGLLARLLVNQRPRALARASIPADATVPVPERLATDAQFVDAVALLSTGFQPEAGIVLDLVVDRLAPLSDPERLALASAYRRSGATLPGFRLLSPAAGRAGVVAPGPADGAATAAWNLLYPVSFPAELDGAATSAGVSPELLRALAREESTFDPAAVSPTGAVGLCQIQTPAAKESAAILRRGVPSKEELLDPAVNAAIGATYLRARLDASAHPLLAIAAYNRGPTSIAALARKLGAIPIDTFVERIPARETREYVKRVVGSWDAYLMLDPPWGGATFPLAHQPRSKPSR